MESPKNQPPLGDPDAPGDPTDPDGVPPRADTDESNIFQFQVNDETGTGGQEVVVEYTVYVPQTFDGDGTRANPGNPILDPATGIFVDSENTATANPTGGALNVTFQGLRPRIRILCPLPLP